MMRTWASPSQPMEHQISTATACKRWLRRGGARRWSRMYARHRERAIPWQNLKHMLRATTTQRTSSKHLNYTTHWTVWFTQGFSRKGLRATAPRLINGIHAEQFCCRLGAFLSNNLYKFRTNVFNFFAVWDPCGNCMRNPMRNRTRNCMRNCVTNCMKTYRKNV